MNIRAPRCSRTPSHTPSPTVKPASKIETLASSRGVSTPFSETSTWSLRGSCAKSWLPGILSKRPISSWVMVKTRRPVTSTVKANTVVSHTKKVFRIAPRTLEP